jgi:N-acyl-phosphatidylethanolamine-hydrolysing phospholipase D
MRKLGPLALLGIAVAAAGAARAPAQAETPAGLGPAPRAADGRFENFSGPLLHAGPSVTLPFFLRRVASRWSEIADLPPALPNDGRAFREAGAATNPTVTWVGHATLLVRMSGLSFLTDPIWSDVAGPARFAGAWRYLPPGLALEALPPIDFVVISHNHYDHMDLETLRRLAERDPRTLFVVPLGNGATLREAGIESVAELDWGQSLEVGPARVVCVPTQHWSRRGLADENRALWSAWAVLGRERRFYFAGDSGWFDGFERTGAALGPFDLAAVPIGAYEPAAMMKLSHLDPEEAVRAALALRARRMLAVHYGTFDLSDEPIGEPPRRFLEAARAQGVAEGDAWTLAVGETRHF